MRTILPALLPICVCLSQGCQWLGDIERSRSANVARADHAACEERGYTWPGEAYTECRRLLADDRQREQWSELQMSRQQQQRQEIGIDPASPVEPYRPIREDRFRCRETTTPKGDVHIVCAEDDRF